MNRLRVPASPLWRCGRHVSAAGFVELTHYYRPAGLRREQQPCAGRYPEEGHFATFLAPFPHRSAALMLPSTTV